MDGERFDNLTRTITGATHQSRRGALKWLGGGIVGVLSGSLAYQRPAAAAPKDKNNKKNQTICGKAGECFGTSNGGYSYGGCQCVTAYGEAGCEVDGVCCLAGFTAPGVCYCAPSAFGCAGHPGCAVGGRCEDCCSKECLAVPGYTGGVCR